MYKLTNLNCVIRKADDAYIPIDNRNPDYRQYLAWLEYGNTPLPADVPTLAQLKAQAVLKIDTEADKIYSDVVGNKAEEYRSAETDARAFVAAGYTGAAGTGVTSWSAAKSWTNKQAADDIITQASAWRAALGSIRANRLGKKEAVKVAADEVALTAVLAQWAAFVTAIRKQLGV